MTPMDFTRAQIEGLPLFYNNEDLVKILPNTKFYLVVPGVNSVTEYFKLIQDLRPDIDTSNIQFRYSKSGKGIYPSIQNPGEFPVYFDYRVLQMALLNIVHYHNKVFNAAY